MTAAVEQVPDTGQLTASRASLTADLLDRAHGSSDPHRRHLLERVIELNLEVAEAVAARYRRRGVSFEDLRQAAYVGLTKAVYRFDPTRRRDLLAFAVPTIRGELQRHFRDQCWTIRPPRRVQDLQSRVHHCIEQLTQRLGHEPTEAEVRRELGVSDAEYAAAVNASACFHPLSLDQPANPESATTLGDLLAHEPGGGGPLVAADARATLAPVVRQLPARDRRVLYLRYFEQRTQEQIGDELGVTQMQVSRLLARILRDIRARLG